MNPILVSSGISAFFMYAIAATLLPQERTRRRAAGIAAVATVALLLHCLAITQSDGKYWWALLAGAVLAIASIIAAITCLGKRIAATGFTIAAATLLALFVPASADALGTHLLLIYIACGFLSLAAIQAIVMSIQEQQLHARCPSRILSWLAPLNDMEKLLFEQITLGFFILSMGLVAGMATQYEILGNPQLIRKVLLSLLVWLTFGILLWGRWYRGWRARTAVLWTLSGCTVLGMAYIASHLATANI